MRVARLPSTRLSILRFWKRSKTISEFSARISVLGTANTVRSQVNLSERLDTLTAELKVLQARKELGGAKTMRLSELANLIADRLRSTDISNPDFISLTKLLLELTTTTALPKYRPRDVRDRILRAKPVKRKVSNEEKLILELEAQKDSNAELPD
jgi:hypothetical protein